MASYSAPEFDDTAATVSLDPYPFAMLLPIEGNARWIFARDAGLVGPPVRLYSNFIRGIRSLPVVIKS